ncbi:MAG: hypothetical protein RR248_00080 [Clostridia bacterium]
MKIKRIAILLVLLTLVSLVLTGCGNENKLMTMVEEYRSLIEGQEFTDADLDKFIYSELPQETILKLKEDMTSWPNEKIGEGVTFDLVLKEFVHYDKAMTDSLTKKYGFKVSAMAVCKANYNFVLQNVSIFSGSTAEIIFMKIAGNWYIGSVIYDKTNLLRDSNISLPVQAFADFLVNPPKNQAVYESTFNALFNPLLPVEQRDKLKVKLLEWVTNNAVEGSNLKVDLKDIVYLTKDYVEKNDFAKIYGEEYKVSLSVAIRIRVRVGTKTIVDSQKTKNPQIVLVYVGTTWYIADVIY